MLMNETVTTKTVRVGAFPPGHAKVGGRKKGVTNKRTALLKDAILVAAERAGNGDIAAYLERDLQRPNFSISITTSSLDMK